MIFKNCWKSRTSLAKVWVDYQKAYGTVSYSWILECMEMFKVADNIRNIIAKSMTSWETQLTSYGKRLGKVNIKRRMLRGDSLSPILFVLCLIPLSMTLRKVKAGYKFRTGQVNINHSLFMDDLKSLVGCW